MNKKISVSVAVALGLIAMTVTFAITMIVSMRIFDNTVSNVMQKQVLNNKIAEIDKYVRGNFYGTIEEEYLQDKTAQGYIDGLRSSGSAYYNPTEYSELQDIESGSLVGIGIEVIKDASNYYKIAKVYPESPAANAGMKEGGYIVSIGDTPVKNFTNIASLNSAIYGAPGTTLDLSVRYNQSETVAYAIQRVRYAAPTVESEIIDNISYIRILSFTENTYAEFDYAIRDAESANVAGIIFDVRNNNSGQNEFAFNEAARLVDRVSPLGKIGYYLQKNNTERTFSTSDAETWVNLPMVVLVNNNTGGAAELFALGIKELNNAQIAGNTTMGKALMLSMPQRLSDGSAISVAIGKVFPANGTDFETVGITPDVEIIVNTEEANPYRVDTKTDVQVLRGLELLRGLAKVSGTIDNTVTSEITSAIDETVDSALIASSEVVEESAA